MTPSLRQESHRIYWQQWAATPDALHEDRKKPEISTGSAAVRISDAAKTSDVTALLRKTLELPDSDKSSQSPPDALVLVGTLHSLPKSYVQFEHEQNDTSRQRDSEPLHVIRTLQPDENPLRVRDVLLEHLRARQVQAPTQRTVIAPRLQWFFVPSSTRAPDCIDLEGYCTDMEPAFADTGQESDDENECIGHGAAESLEVELDDPVPYPWRPSTDDSKTADLENQVDAEERIRQEESIDDDVYRILAREHQFYQLLSSNHAVVHRQCVSGFMLKRSRKDRHLWRRIFCILTDEHLWCISRLYTIGSSENQQRVAKHQSISLSRALLLEPSADYAPLDRIPCSFEVVSSSGKSHIFRTSSRTLQLRWIQCLGERILQTHENKTLEHAELIVEDEALARNRRILRVAAEPLMGKYSNCTDDASESAVLGVLQLGMDVADYRERCRHIQARMPSRRAVVVSDGTDPSAPTPRKLFDSPCANGQIGISHSNEVIDPDARAMIRAAWDTASLTLAKATQLAMDQSNVDDKKGRSMGRKVENLCRHVDYVITGRLRTKDEPTEESSGRVDRSNDNHPPPMDLFDPLLEELQANTGITHEGDANGNLKMTNIEY